MNAYLLEGRAVPTGIWRGWLLCCWDWDLVISTFVGMQKMCEDMCTLDSEWSIEYLLYTRSLWGQKDDHKAEGSTYSIQFGFKRADLWPLIRVHPAIFWYLLIRDSWPLFSYQNRLLEAIVLIPLCQNENRWLAAMHGIFKMRALYTQNDSHKTRTIALHQATYIIFAWLLQAINQSRFHLSETLFDGFTACFAYVWYTRSLWPKKNDQLHKITAFLLNWFDETLFCRAKASS